MKLALPVLAGILSLATPAPAAQETATPLPESTPAMKTALDQVVSQQLAAFAAGNFAQAYTFAAAGIQKLFPADLFEKMVRTSYPIMLTSPKIDFGVALDDGQQGVLFVELTGPQGVEVFRYQLIHEAKGWKINGVEQVEKGPSAKPRLTA